MGMVLYQEYYKEISWKGFIDSHHWIQLHSFMIYLLTVQVYSIEYLPVQYSYLLVIPNYFDISIYFQVKLSNIEDI